MADERLSRLLAHLCEGGDAKLAGGCLCEVAVDVADVTGAAIALYVDGLPQQSLCVTDSVAAAIEDLQYTLGEGPGVDAHRDGVAALEADLDRPLVPRWPVFAPRVVEVGARAIFGFPVRVGKARLGTLDLYRERPGPLSAETHANVLVVADVVARVILAGQRDGAPEAVAFLSDAEMEFPLVVHQAGGVISVQLGVSVSDALLRLRAYAFRTERPITAVAQDVVARRLRFSDGDHEESPSS